MDVFQQVVTIFFLGLAFFCFHFIAKHYGFYKLPVKQPVFIPLSYFLGSFFLYFIVFLVFPSILTGICKIFYHKNIFSTFGWAQLTACVLCAACLFRFSLCFDRIQTKRIWKNHATSNPSSLYRDCSIGIATWTLGFPLSLAIGQFFDLIIHVFFHAGSYEQVAVHQFKIALQSPPLLASTLVSVLLFAPIAEEFLFRGLLQNFLKKFMQTKYALFLSSLIFALIHISQSQGFGNIPLVASLFAFGYFLGFIYERQGSLFAPISLHMIFNAISAVQIFLCKDQIT